MRAGPMIVGYHGGRGPRWKRLAALDPETGNVFVPIDMAGKPIDVLTRSIQDKQVCFCIDDIYYVNSRWVAWAYPCLVDACRLIEFNMRLLT